MYDKGPNPSPSSLAAEFVRVRGRSVALVAPLAAEDTVVQSMPDVSPTKWHLAHTTWFFEQFLLMREGDYRPLQQDWLYLFNSYYESVGPRHQRVQRGLLSRPTLAEVLDYRARVDERVLAVLERDIDEALTAVLRLGLQHEQQHQELMLTDIKHVFSVNPLEPAYQATATAPTEGRTTPLRWIAGAEGLHEIGHPGASPDGGDFAFDSETPRHRVFVAPHRLASRPVINAEYREFIRDGGYATPAVWMSEGWAAVQNRGWRGPMYWDEAGETEFTLAGRREISADAPVCHLSYFEADAFARWAGARLPTEAEWELAAAALPELSAVLAGAHWADAGYLHPRPARDAGPGPVQLFGDVWEWTQSPYVAYPGYRPLPGALGEYNGKFMCGQWVLRGGSCVTPAGHLRASYRNFFYPPDRWQFMGLRLAQDA